MQTNERLDHLESVLQSFADSFLSAEFENKLRQLNDQIEELQSKLRFECPHCRADLTYLFNGPKPEPKHETN